MSKKNKEPRPYRGVIDEIREQQHKMKDMTLKGKLQYFWYYYKVHTIISIAVILLSATLIHDILSAKDYIFYGIMLNSIGLSSESMESSFGEYAGLDLETYECFIDTSSTISYSTPSEYTMATIQKLMAQVQSTDLDAVVFDSQVFYNYASTELFADLTTLLTPEELEKYQDNLYYIDYGQVDASEESFDYEEDAMVPVADIYDLTIDEIREEAETHRHPETMQRPVPVGIFMEDSPFIKATNSYGQAQPIFGVIINTTRPETAKQYLSYLWDEDVDFESVRETDFFPG